MINDLIYPFVSEPLKGIYKHYKGKYYEVLEIATHSETLEEMVVYKACYGNFKVWVRTLRIFTEEVEFEGKKVKRFEKITSSTV